MSKPDLCMVEKQVSVKVGQLWSHVGGKRAQDPGCSDAEGPGWTLAGQTPLSCFCACAHVCLGSLPGHVKGFLEENRLSTFQSTSAEPTGEGRSSRKAVWWVMDRQATSSPQCLWQHPCRCPGWSNLVWKGSRSSVEKERGEAAAPAPGSLLAAECGILFCSEHA